MPTAPKVTAIPKWGEDTEFRIITHTRRAQECEERSEEHMMKFLTESSIGNDEVAAAHMERSREFNLQSLYHRGELAKLNGTAEAPPGGSNERG